MPLQELKYTFDTHLAKSASKISPTNCTWSLGDSLTTPSRPSSTVTHSKTSTRPATSYNPLKPPKPQRTPGLHHAKTRSTSTSTPLQLHGTLGTAALFGTNLYIIKKRACTQHHWRAAKLLHSYITLAAAAEPYHTYQIKFFEDYYPHVPVTSTQFSATQILKTITSAISHHILTTRPTLWINMEPTNVSASMMGQGQYSRSKTNWGTSANRASAKVKRLKHCLVPSPHEQDGCCYTGKIETSAWFVASRTWSTGWSPMRLQHGVRQWRRTRLNLQ